MSGLFNFLKNLFSGIFGFLGGLLGSKKDSATGAAPKVKASKSTGFFLEVDDAKGVGTTAAVSAPAITTTQPKPAAAAKVAPAKAPEPVVVANTLNLPQPTVTTTASDFLSATVSSNGRRRPGANMASYLTMARQVKTPV
jgi:hypothetical protein